MITSTSAILRRHFRVLPLSFLAVGLFLQGHLGAQQANRVPVVVIQSATLDDEQGWLQLAAEQALLDKAGQVPGWEVQGWRPPPKVSQEQLAQQAEQETGAEWIIHPQAFQSSDGQRIFVRVFKGAPLAEPKLVDVSLRPGRLPSLLSRAVRLTLEAAGVQKEVIDSALESGFGTNSSLALERYYRGTADWLAGKEEEAVAAYQSSLSSDANFEPSRRALANGYYDLGMEAYSGEKWDDAADLFSKSAGTFQDLVDRATDALAAANSDAEKGRLQSQIKGGATSKKTCDAWASLSQGSGLLHQGDRQGAKAKFEAALTVQEGFQPARSALAGLQLQDAQAKEEAPDFAGAGESYLAAADAYSSLGELSNTGLALAGASRCAEKQGQAQDAVTFLLEAAKQYTSAGDYRSARDLLLGPSYGLAATFGLLDDNPSRSKGHFLLAVGFMRSSERALIEQCDTSSPEGTLRFIPTGEVIASEAEMPRWKRDKVVEEAQKASNLDPTDAASFLLLGRAYLFADRPDSLARAIEAFSKARDLQPGSIEPRVFLGESLYKANHFDEAEKEFQAACQIPLQPGQEEWANRAWADLGDLMNKVRRHQEAAAAFAKAISFSARDSVSYLGWATALFHLGQLEEAKQKLEDARQISPSLPGLAELQVELEKASAAAAASPH